MTTTDAPENQTHASDEAFARRLDAEDPLRRWRGEFLIPDSPTGDGSRAVYLCGNSLGCQPRGVRAALERELEDWARLGVDGHLHARSPWFTYHENFRDIGARLVGARPGEVVMMNSLTVNLHLLMVSFYRPTRERFKIVIERDAFPSDWYAVRAQAELHARDAGFDPDKAIVALEPREGEHTLRTEDIVALLEDEGESIALVMLGGVNYKTGQWFQMERITAEAKARGCFVGWDLAHAAGNVPMKLHDWGVDFAAWCSYKYLNAGPGAVAGAFVHESHGSKVGGFSDTNYLPRLAGWWGNDPETRFQMRPEFVPRRGADAWQLSNPPILAMAPLKVSLDIFDEVGMEALREKSLKLTGYMKRLLQTTPGASIVSPDDPAQRGAQLSLNVTGDARTVHGKLHDAGVIADFREPDVIRVAPTPLYNSFHDVWRFVTLLRDAVA